MPCIFDLDSSARGSRSIFGTNRCRIYDSGCTIHRRTVLYPMVYHMGISYGVLSRSAATARRIRRFPHPPARLQPRPPPAPTTRAEEVLLRPRLEENGGHMRLRLGVEHRLISEELVSCVRRAKCKSTEKFESGGLEFSPQVRAVWHTPELRARLRGDPSAFDTIEAMMASTCEHTHSASAPGPRRSAVWAGAHHAPTSTAVSASAQPPRGRPRHEPWLKRPYQRTGYECPKSKY